MMNGRKAGYIGVNGLRLRYEVQGTGAPLVLLQFGVGTTDSVGQVPPLIARMREVIAVNLHANGRSSDVNGPLRYELLADDIATLLDRIGLETADVMGHSLGGGVALRLAIQHPRCVRRLVLVSTAFRQDGWYPEVEARIRQLSRRAASGSAPTPMEQAYAEVAPTTEALQLIVDRLGDLLRREYDWSRDVASIRAPTLLLYADADSIPASHAVALFGLLGGGRMDPGADGVGRAVAQLGILPGQTHSSILEAPALAWAVRGFLDRPIPGVQ
jgi:pimeloyl-ACP methyl ester carboxylesterase